MKPLAFTIGCLLVFALCGCGTQSRFASSFGKRRYNKGFYWDRAGEASTVASGKPGQKEVPDKATIHKSNNVVPSCQAKPTQVPPVVKVAVKGDNGKNKVKVSVVHKMAALAKAISRIKSAPPGDGRHIADNQNATGNASLSIASFATFLASIVMIIILLGDAMYAYGGDEEFAILAGYLFFIFDIAAIILAILALTHPGEAMTGMPKAVLIVNLVLIVLLLLSSAAIF